MITLSESTPTRPLYGQEWIPNIFVESENQLRSGEKHWQGIPDLSAKAQISYTHKSLQLKVRVKDDSANFSGGKFPYDNDSIQFYFDRRPDEMRGVNYITEGIYGFLLIPGIFGSASTLQTIGTLIEDPDDIGVSTQLISEGYEVFIDIPWNKIGGQPQNMSFLGFDLLINDRDSGIRRDMQMIWSGDGENERIYLKQEQHDPTRFG